MKMNEPQLTRFLRQEFPQVADDFCVRINGHNELMVEMPVGDKHLRPGQTVSGPSMFALADVTFYLAILQKTGPEALAVTTSANINFMRKPGRETLVGKPSIHKFGRRLVVGDVLIHALSDKNFERPMVSASLTYCLPPKEKKNR